ncbi:12411_t:CDS:2 [Funneliformis geosporum]|uniref:13851_t:CDS:1 n=1 Tax=Funneliformis geosporum TaxID=1117311 RepID=A0A9W4SLT6_9GLOM|nr:12411_t:CDS:2 [Funneliformis geosporum]CAI2174773.1 13851_t:CDS:2 [Funneliformis geosporum]
MSEFYHPFKRKFSPEDPFFTLGNLEFRFDWLKKHSHLQIEEVFNEELKSLTITNPIACCSPPWCNKNPLMFYTALDYETHYNASHRHFCQECDKVFPSERWLNLHLTEFHDIMTLMRKEKDYHKYPKTFNFGILVNGIIPFSIRNAENIRKQKRKNSNRNLESSQSPMKHDNSASYLKIDSFHSTATEPGTMDVDSLTKSMSNLRLPRVPKTITFGMRTGYKGRVVNAQTSQHKGLKEKVSFDNTQEAMENVEFNEK